mmetsp:Transcript_21901/g.43926  ORF Transcript_21901/g.43926 Transcript_21901/m.43926 type:complete len:445 (-) Transcript_21901:35-1369(-)
MMNGGLDALAALCGNDSIDLSLPNGHGVAKALSPDPLAPQIASGMNAKINSAANCMAATPKCNQRPAVVNHGVPNFFNPANFLSGFTGFSPQNSLPSSQVLWPGLNPQIAATFAANQNHNQEIGAGVAPSNLSNLLKSHGLDVGSAAANALNTLQQQQALFAASQAVQQSQAVTSKVISNTPQQVHITTPIIQRPNILSMPVVNAVSPPAAATSEPSQIKFDTVSTNNISSSISNTGCTSDSSVKDGNPDDKKQLKRAANRRSAQLSRKRKKVFIEELKDENDELRRKEQILKNIPDLIIVFEPTGKIFFVSHSVSNFLDYSPDQLEGLSLWDRLSSESVRLIKAAFMDALAARSPGGDMVPLGGVWDLELVDKSGKLKEVTLNGVVHFKGDSPECVCSIRSRKTAKNETPPTKTESKFVNETTATVVSLQDSEADSSSSSCDE